MNERLGPHVNLVKNILTCLGCKHLYSVLINTGKYPQYEMYCDHEKADSCVGGWLGGEGDVETPKWCPYLKDNRGNQ